MKKAPNKAGVGGICHNTSSLPLPVSTFWHVEMCSSNIVSHHRQLSVTIACWALQTPLVFGLCFWANKLTFICALLIRNFLLAYSFLGLSIYFEIGPVEFPLFGTRSGAPWFLTRRLYMGFVWRWDLFQCVCVCVPCVFFYYNTPAITRWPLWWDPCSDGTRLLQQRVPLQRVSCKVATIFIFAQNFRTAPRGEWVPVCSFAYCSPQSFLLKF